MTKKSGFLASFAVALIALSSGIASAHTYTVEPTGDDDTANLQAALDDCVAHGAGCTVQLVAGTYRTRQLVAYDLRGRLRGHGREATVVEALPDLHVVAAADPTRPFAYCDVWPTPAEPWATFLTFVGGSVTISDFTIRLPHSPAALPWEATFDCPGEPDGLCHWRRHNMENMIQFLGARADASSDAVVERMKFEARVSGLRPDGTDESGCRGCADIMDYFNTVRAIHFQGITPLPPDSCLVKAQPIVGGRFVVRHSLFQDLMEGLLLDSVKDGELTIGGAPGAGNRFVGTSLWAVRLWEVTGSKVEISHNDANGMWEGAVNATNGVGWGWWEPGRPTVLKIHQNRARVWPWDWQAAVLLTDYYPTAAHPDVPSSFKGLVYANHFELEPRMAKDPIWAWWPSSGESRFLAGGVLGNGADSSVVAGNVIRGESAAGLALGVQGDLAERWKLFGNHLGDLTISEVPIWDGPKARVWLGAGSKASVVAVGRADDVLDEGTGNRVIVWP